MRKIIDISKREIKGYFLSPIAYIVISIFLVISGWFFFSTFFIYNQAETRDFFALLPITFSFFIPAVTMRLFSEEFNTGSYELLYTMPVSTVHIVIGKFIASVMFICIMLVPTFSYGVSVSLLGDMDIGPYVGGYAGALMIGAMYSSIGLFASSLTRNQIVAFISGMSICIMFTLLDKLLFFVPENMVYIVQYMGADYHFKNFSRGIIDSRDIVYFASLTFIMLYSTDRVIKQRV